LIRRAAALSNHTRPLRSDAKSALPNRQRYSSEGRSRTRFHSRSIETLREHFPNVRAFSDDARAVVSEPLGAVENASKIWVEVPESSALIVAAGSVDVVPLRPWTELAA
jgi:hypothetical protein